MDEEVQGISVESLEKIAQGFLIDRRAQNVTAGTLKFYKTKVTLFIKYCAAEKIFYPDQLTPDLMRRWLIQLKETGHNDGGIHAAFRAIRTFFNWWEQESGDWSSPLHKVKPPHLSTEPLDPVETDDIKRILNACRGGWHATRDKAIFLTLLDTGARATELIEIQMDDMDITAGSIQIRQGKGRKPRFVFIGRRTRQAIRSWLKRRGPTPGHLFISDDDAPLRYHGLRMILRRRCEEAGVEGVTLHDFRRAFCLSQLQAGVPETAIARMMGHATTVLIARYAKQSKEDLEKLYRSPADGNI